ncbi:integral membrane protein [Colletotrichum tofieldiae]|uniref:Integral membrane protein n=1 Tax=Colletotrichum tofieldiae TaxID=708197 RepID=A0A166T3G0_9PEZI|nr:integral membrane protein [Colletotrichum tofieldiae]
MFLFTVVSALYLAACDLILALLPWRMIFNLQMKRSERISVALALSMGVLAGVTGIMKAVQGYVLINVRSPDYLYNQAVYWIWSMAEPNVAIISASIPVLRGFVRDVRKGTESSPGGDVYRKTGGTSGSFYDRNIVTVSKTESQDHSILAHTLQDGDIGNKEAVTRTTETSIDFKPRPESGHREGFVKPKRLANVAEFEMDRIDHPDNRTSRSK